MNDTDDMSFDMDETGGNKPAVVNQGTAVANKAFTGSVGIDAASAADLASAGVVVGELGEVKISRIPIEKFKASTARVSRIAFLSRTVQAIKFHYYEGIGSILCFGGKCCEVCGMPNVRYLFPVVEYSTDADGEIVGKKINMRMLSLGEDAYKSIITTHNASARDGGIDFVDLMVVCTDDKFQKMTFNNCGPAAWRQSEKFAKKLLEQWLQDSKFAFMAVARSVDEATFINLYNDLTGGGSAVPGTAGNVYTGNKAQGGVSAKSNEDMKKFFDDED